jgi:WD40 repeat protein
VGLWDTDSGEKKANWTDPGVASGSYVFAMAFSPNGKVLATAGSAGTGTIRLWGAATGQSRGALKGHTSAVYSIAFDRDGQTLVSASIDGSVRLWNVVTGQECINLKFPPGETWPFVTFGHDGKALVVGTPDGTVQLLRAADDREALASKTELNPDDPDSASALINEDLGRDHRAHPVPVHHDMDQDRESEQTQAAELRVVPLVERQAPQRPTGSRSRVGKNELEDRREQTVDG